VDARPPGSPRSLTREVLDLAAPAVLSGFVQMAYHWVNQAWVGRLPDGTTATAALSVASYTVWAFHALTMLLGVGLTALVGRYAGGGRQAVARWVAAQGLRWSIVLSAVAGVVGILLAPWVFSVAHVSEAAAADGTGYVRLFYLFGFSTFLQVACDAVWRGHGTTRVPLVTSALGLALNAALDPILIFGWGPVPAMGVEGAAVATAIAATCAAALSLAWLRSRGLLSSVRPPDEEVRLSRATPLAPGPVPALDASVLLRLVRVGLPVALSGLFFVAVYLGLARIVARAGGDAAQAGLGVGIRGEQVAYFLTQGFAMAAGALVARRLGAGAPDAAERAAWRATALASVGCLVWSVLILAVPEVLARLFLPGAADAAARAHAVEYYRLVALCLVPQCWEGVLDGAFGGAGLTVPPMIVSMTLTGARIPLAHWAAFDLGHGVTGIWVVIVVTAALRGIVTAVWFARGTWKRRPV
jgi:putative MATE family efflux protein